MPHATGGTTPRTLISGVALTRCLLAVLTVLAAALLTPPETASAHAPAVSAHRADTSRLVFKQAITPRAGVPCRGYVYANKQAGGDIRFGWTLYCTDGRNHHIRIAPVVSGPSGTKYWNGTNCYATTECTVHHTLPDRAGANSWFVAFDPAHNGTVVGGAAGEYYCSSGISCENRSFSI